LDTLVSALKSSARQLVAPILHVGWYSRLRHRLEVTSNRQPLKPGITAIVAARNEAYLIPFCLESLVGAVDQVVCVDNGSGDGTLALMHEFQTRRAADLDIEVLVMPDALLGECRQAALELTRHEWHLRWDADMVCRTTGPETFPGLRRRVLTDDRPRAIQLPRTNLVGDLHHTHRLFPVIDPGEPILMRFSQLIKYREIGRFDVIRVPLSYRQVIDRGHYYVHCAGLKSDENLIHRFHYFAWREALNAAPDASTRHALADFEVFKRQRNLEFFGTTAPASLKFRYQRQLVYHLQRYDEAAYGQYPEVLRYELERPDPRFEVIYRDGRPYLRLDRADRDMLDYRPTADDLAWDPEAFLRRFLTPAQCLQLGITSAA